MTKSKFGKGRSQTTPLRFPTMNVVTKKLSVSVKIISFEIVFHDLSKNVSNIDRKMYLN